MEAFVNLISNVGFPIACVICMGLYINTTVKDLSKTIADNTMVLEKLLTKLNIDE